MFVKFTCYHTGNPVYVNPELICGITHEDGHACIWSCDHNPEPFVVKESPEEVVQKFEDEFEMNF